MDDQTEGQAPDQSSAPGEKGSQEAGRRRAKLAGGIGAGVAVGAGAAVAATALIRSRTSTPEIPQGSILVNGVTHRVQSSPDTPLLYVLRDELGVHSPKFGCGLGQCGACAVLVGDKETRACVTAWTSVKAEVTTLEGLSARWARQKGLSAAEATKTLHPVQQAWIDQQVPQCGYCQSGMMVMAVDLLTRVSSPTEAQIRESFTSTPPSPHLCRCGTYMSIIAAVQRAARSMA
jgi:isoquinoline 1-oxidoreductase alpha subunit